MTVSENSNLKYKLTCLLLFVYSAQAIASSFMPAVTNFLAKDYKAGYQNWACAQGENGEMYFGNTQGLLVYDGYRWELHKVPGNHIIRSVFVKGDRIYIGSFEEFGYFSHSATGKLHYHSLSKFLKNFPMENNEIWNIVEQNGSINFQSFSSWFSFDGKMIRGYRNRKKQPLYFYTLNKHVYVQMIDDGFYKLNGKNFDLLFPRNKIENDDIVALLPGKDKRDMLLVTGSHGLFHYDGSITPWHTDIDEKLMKQKINRAVMTKDSIFMIGTVLNGIYAINRKGNCLWHLNLDNRLNNNTVLGLFCDMDNNVWATLDDGIAYIHHNSPITLMIPSNHEIKIGMVYDIAHRKDHFYLATNQGIYEYNQTNRHIRLLPHTQGQNWYVKDIDGQLFAGNNAHTLLIDNDGNISTINNTNSSTCLSKCTLYGEEILLESSYTNLRIYKKKNGKWSFSHVINGFSAPVMHIEVDQSGIIWASHMYQGIYKIILTDDLKSVKSMSHISHLGMKQISGTIQVMKIRGRIVFSGADTFYTYDDISQQIIPFQKMNTILSYIKNAHSSISVSSNRFWLSSSQEYTLIEYKDGEYIVKRHIPSDLFDSPCIENYNNVFMDNDTVYFNLNNAVARYTKGTDSFDPPLHSNLSIHSVICSSSEKQEKWLPLSGNAELSCNYRDLLFRLSLPHYTKKTIYYRYTLQGKGMTLTSEQKEAEIRYGSLEYGQYTFKAEAFTDLRQKIGEIKYNFIIARPFYLSFYAFVIYLCLLIVLIYFLSKWRTNYAMKKKQREFEAEQREQKLKMRDQERTIALQQQQLLETELSAKSKDLASMALGIFAKNEILEKLRSAIQDFLVKGQYGRKNFDFLLKLINENIETQEFWDVFQKNFDLIHEKFFRNLRERYPTLTATDLRFCALLRLNLSTKDIAQMTNLTIRGVEAARYRLRKKMDVPDGTGLVDFLIEIK